MLSFLAENVSHESRWVYGLGILHGVAQSSLLSESVSRPDSDVALGVGESPTRKAQKEAGLGAGSTEPQLQAALLLVEKPSSCLKSGLAEGAGTAHISSGQSSGDLEKTGSQLLRAATAAAVVNAGVSAQEGGVGGNQFPSLL